MKYIVRTSSDVKHVAEQDDLWKEEGELVVNGTSTHAITAEIEGFRLGYTATEHALVVFVAGGVSADVVQVRSLSDESRGYAFDPLVGHSLSEVDQEWQNLFLGDPNCGSFEGSTRSSVRFPEARSPCGRTLPVRKLPR